MDGERTHKITPITIAQTVYLVGRNYFRNSLISHARACSFAFLFSFIPIFMMITTVLIRILHASPETIVKIFKFIPELSPYFDAESVILAIQNTGGVHWFEILVGVFIFWAARGLFAAIFLGLKDIFHIAEEPRPVVRQLVMLIIEVAIVVLIAAIIFFLIMMQTISTLPIFNALNQKILPLTSFLSHYHLTSLPNILLFPVIVILYKMGTGTKIPFKLCFVDALLCNMTFWAFQLAMHTFIDYGRYMVIYGVLAKLLIVMLDVLIFFILFFFYAQLLFVYQFFDELLLGELYCLPKQNAKKLFHILRRILFIRPDYLMAKDVNMIHLKTNETIFMPDDTGTDAYYIARGTVKETRANGTSFYERGDFLGEASCVFEKKRETSAICMTDVDLVRIDSSTFQLAIAQNGDVAQKLLGQISTYFNEVYGRTEDFAV